MSEPGTAEVAGAGSENPAEERLAAVLEKLDQTLAQQQARSSSTAPAAAEPAPKKDTQPVYTAAQLQGFVDDGKITQAQATEYLLQQQQRQLDEKLQQQREADQKATTEQLRLDARIKQYAAALPDLSQTGSESWKRFEAAYQDLRSDGEPDSLKTQLRALQIEFGRDPSKLLEVTETTKQRQVSSERSGSGGSQSKTPKDDGKGPPAWLRSDPLWDHYNDGVRKGRYNGWDDPQIRGELKRLKAKRDAA